MMKRTIYISGLMALASLQAWGNTAVTNPVPDKAPMKALSLYTTEVIDEAPAGKVINNLSRNGWSSYFKEGSQYREAINGMQGEYVMGDDGNIYLRYACASIAYYLDTYLMLEPVDETTYVAHTPQLIWCEENTDGSLFTAYATRLVHSQLGTTSFTYSLDMDGEKINTDIYFTLGSDGSLRQKDLETVDMNGEIFPHEIIGFTTSTGQYIGFGDGLVTLDAPGETPAVLPDGAVARDMSLAFSNLYLTGSAYMDAVPVKGAEVGDDLYILNPFSREESWMKGRIDRASGKVIFGTQYLGMDSEAKCAMWLVPAVYENVEEPWLDDSDVMEWRRRYQMTDQLVLSYSDGTVMSEEGQSLFISRVKDDLVPVAVFDDPKAMQSAGEPLRPVNPEYVRITSWDDFFEVGKIIFSFPRIDTNNNAIPSEELLYNIYANGGDIPYTATPETWLRR